MSKQLKCWTMTTKRTDKFQTCKAKRKGERTYGTWNHYNIMERTLDLP